MLNHRRYLCLEPAPAVLGEMPADWMERASRKQYRLLEVVVPSLDDLLVPKLKRGAVPMPADIKRRLRKVRESS